MPSSVRASALLANVGPGRSAEQPVVAMALVLVAMVCFSVADAISKELARALPPIEIAWLRWAGFAIIMSPLALAHWRTIFVAHAPVSQTLRALGLLGSSVFFINGLQHLPMATATAIGFVSPLFVTLLSIPILGEVVGIRRWGAIVVGLIGVLIVVQPGGSSFDVYAIWPLLSALCWATGVIFTRRASGIDGPETAMLYTTLVGLVVLSVLVPSVWVTPDLTQVALAFAMAGCALAGQTLIVFAYARAAASLLAPFSYSQIIWSTALGFVLFGNIPAVATWIGAAIIIASGVYTAHRERVRAREAEALRRRALS